MQYCLRRRSRRRREGDTQEKKKEEEEEMNACAYTHTHTHTHRPLFVQLQSLNYFPNEPYNSTHCLQSRWQRSTIYPVTGNTVTA